MSTTAQNNEHDVSAAFSKQSTVFDEIDEANSCIGWVRERVRKEVHNYLPDNARMLELNCGTGIDSVYFAKQGVDVVATDNADGMLATLNKKIAHTTLEQKIKTRKCSFNQIDSLNEGTFDYVFSNFGGLNCTDKLYEVLDGIDKVLNPGGYFTVVIMPVFCPWEVLTVFRGYFKTAFRRFKNNGTAANVEGVKFQCYYYNPSYVIKHMGNAYELQSTKGLCITVPPPFIENFRERHGKLFSFLERIENGLYKVKPFNAWCDHYVITMKKMP